jgi:DNA-binding transcriptional MerR regulator
MRSIGEIAAQAGVSVRTLRFYEQKGLLKSVRSEGGQRHYGVAQVQRLQEILLLKSLGLKLQDIQALFARGGVEAGAFLDLQMEALAEQKHRIDDVLARLAAARAAIRAGQSLDISSLCDLIKSTGRLKMEQDWKTITDKYYTKEQLAELAKRAPSPKEQEEISARWANLKARVARLAEAGADPAGPEAQECAREWSGLIEAFTGGNPGIAQSLQRMYEDRENWPSQPEPPVPDAVGAFVGQMLAALKR